MTPKEQKKAHSRYCSTHKRVHHKNKYFLNCILPNKRKAGNMSNATQTKQGQCPKCNSFDIDYCETTRTDESVGYEFVCNDCKASCIEWHTVVYDETVVVGERDNDQ